MDKHEWKSPAIKFAKFDVIYSILSLLLNLAVLIFQSKCPVLRDNIPTIDVKIWIAFGVYSLATACDITAAITFLREDINSKKALRKAKIWQSIYFLSFAVGIAFNILVYGSFTWKIITAFVEA